MRNELNSAEVTQPAEIGSERELHLGTPSEEFNLTCNCSLKEGGRFITPVGVMTQQPRTT